MSVSSVASETKWSMSPPSEFQREPGNYRPVRSVTLFELLFHPPFLLFVDPLRKLRLMVCLLGKAVYVSRIAFTPYLSPQLYYIRDKASWLAGLSTTASVQP
jgi:hypothetical protein